MPSRLNRFCIRHGASLGFLENSIYVLLHATGDVRVPTMSCCDAQTESASVQAAKHITAWSSLPRQSFLIAP